MLHYRSDFLHILLKQWVYKLYLGIKISQLKINDCFRKTLWLYQTKIKEEPQLIDVTNIFMLLVILPIIHSTMQLKNFIPLTKRFFHRAQTRGCAHAPFCVWLTYLDVCIYSSPCLSRLIFDWIPPSRSDEVLLFVWSNCIIVDLIWVDSWSGLTCCSVNTLVVAQISVQQESKDGKGYQDKHDYHSYDSRVCLLWSGRCWRNICWCREKITHTHDTYNLYVNIACTTTDIWHYNNLSDEKTV